MESLRKKNNPKKGYYCPKEFNTTKMQTMSIEEYGTDHSGSFSQCFNLVFVHYNSPEYESLAKIFTEKLTDFCDSQIGKKEKYQLFIYCDNERINKLPKSEQIKEIDSLIFSAMNQQLPKQKTLSKNIKKVYDIYEQLKSLTEQAQTAENELISHVGIFTKNTQQFFSTVDKDKTQKIEEAKSNNIGNPRKFKEDVSPLTQAEQKAKDECRESYNNIQNCIKNIKDIKNKSTKLLQTINGILDKLNGSDKEYEEDYKTEKEEFVTPLMIQIDTIAKKVEANEYATKAETNYSKILSKDVTFKNFVTTMEDATRESQKTLTQK